MTPSHTDFVEFVKLILNDREPNGTALSALVDGYIRLKANDTNPAVRPIAADHSAPFQVYQIRNLKTGKTYVGRAVKGFLHRYPEGWWEDHHNINLRLDVLVLGVANFQVTVYQCTDTADTCAAEAQLYDLVKENTYNRHRPEEFTPINFLP